MTLHIKRNYCEFIEESGLIIRNNTVTGCKMPPGVTSVKIPEGITSISGTFADCCYLTDIKLPSTLKGIHMNEFKFCTSLKEIEIPEGIEHIGSWAFCGCFSLRKIILPSTLKSIGKYAFENCSSLKYINLPEGLEEIGEGTFDGCSSLQEITIPGGVKIIEDSLFLRCSSLKKVVLSEGIEEVSSSAFLHCHILETIEWPNSLRRIDNRICNEVSIKPFSNTMLSQRMHGDFLIIGDGILLEYKGSAERVIIPPDVRIIADGAFRNNKHIRTVVAFEGLLSIGKYAFRECSSLLKIRLPKGLEYIGYGAFQECSSLSSVKIPDSVTRLSGYAFTNCTSLYKAEPGIGIEEIDIGTFCGCSSLTELILPDNLKRIECDAFSQCTALLKVNIPKTVTYIDFRSFDKTPWLICQKDNAVMAGDNVLFYCNTDKTHGLVVPDDVRHFNIPNCLMPTDKVIICGIQFSFFKFETSEIPDIIYLIKTKKYGDPDVPIKKESHIEVALRVYEQTGEEEAFRFLEKHGRELFLFAVKIAPWRSDLTEI